VIRPAPLRSPELRAELGRIRQLGKAARYPEALAAAQALAAEAPADRDTLYLIAANQRCLDRIADALGTLEQLEREHPDFGLLYQERGYCYTRWRDAPRALAAFLQAVRLNPELAASWNMLERLHDFSERDHALRAAAGSSRLDYIRLLLAEQRYPLASERAARALRFEPSHPGLTALAAAARIGLGHLQEALAAYGQLLAAAPDSAELQVAFGHALQGAGRQNEAVAAYRQAAAIRPGFGDAYWSLANLRTYAFAPEEIAHMRTREAAVTADPVDRCHFCFALGKAYGDRGEYQPSWEFYARGNALKRAQSPYRRESIETNLRRQVEVCTRAFFSERAGTGRSEADPIFVVGLPRSGSTLVEQILAASSRVDGTRELAELPRLVRDLSRRGGDPSPLPYPDLLGELGPQDFAALGGRYLAETQAYRGRKPYFIDKMPNNFRHIGLIHLLFPRATIIDVRREPMACGFSNLKQLFAQGQEFSYGMEEVAHYYRAYLELMRHWDTVLPGRVLRVMYEDLVEDLPGQVERLFAFCQLDLEPACLEFYKVERNIQSPSSEQVRQPIFREGLSAWRNYAPWLGPLRESLGDALVRYRETGPSSPLETYSPRR
jgi:tetratricopeptide (TPR) repeat protein